MLCESYISLPSKNCCLKWTKHALSSNGSPETKLFLHLKRSQNYNKYFPPQLPSFNWKKSRNETQTENKPQFTEMQICTDRNLTEIFNICVGETSEVIRGESVTLQITDIIFTRCAGCILTFIDTFLLHWSKDKAWQLPTRTLLTNRTFQTQTYAHLNRPTHTAASRMQFIIQQKSWCFSAGSRS